MKFPTRIVISYANAKWRRYTMTNSATPRRDKIPRVLFLQAQGAALAIRKRTEMAHMRVHDETGLMLEERSLN